MKKALIALIVMLLLSISIIGLSCQKGISSEGREYLTKMQVWKQKWDSLQSRDAWYFMESHIIELKTIKPPHEIIRCKSCFGENEFNLYAEHTEYQKALSNYVSAERNLVSVVLKIKSRYDQNPQLRLRYPSFDEYYHMDGAYHDAQVFVLESTAKLTVIELEWNSIFSEYLK